MNDLSWMIYAADAVDAANDLFVLVAFFGAAATVGCFIMWAAFLESPIVYSWQDRDEEEALQKAIRDGAAKWLVRLLFISLVAGGLTVATPSSGTIYAIAASEMGETALKSETGGKAVEALNAWLDRQIDGSDTD